jgi:histidyl-tRNA synthetase
MSSSFKAPRGTFDALPEQQPARRLVEDTSRLLLERAGYARIETPIFEETSLFARGVGGSTDIVSKQMFSFTDQGDRELTLRPEGTASVCRAYLEHGMQKWPQPVKLWYSGPFFRHERPQAGRYRQFQQIGAEAIGSDSPLVDAEMIALLADLISMLGIPDARLRLGSLGSVDSRAAYLEELRGYLRANDSELSEEVRGRIDSNPLRAFDADHEGTAKVMAEAPTMLGGLDAADAEHFEVVKGVLDDLGVTYELDPSLVRGLDYYTRTVFEFTCDSLGAQSGVGGGGRYDALIEQLGGKPTPAVGWAAGVERLVLAMPDQAPGPRAEVFVVADDENRKIALRLVVDLRRAGVSADLDLAGRATKGQMKQADRVGAKSCVILDSDREPVVRDMESGEQVSVALSNLVERLSPDAS